MTVAERPGPRSGYAAARGLLADSFAQQLGLGEGACCEGVHTGAGFGSVTGDGGFVSVGPGSALRSVFEGTGLILGPGRASVGSRGVVRAEAEVVALGAREFVKTGLDLPALGLPLGFVSPDRGVGDRFWLGSLGVLFALVDCPGDSDGGGNESPPISGAGVASGVPTDTSPLPHPLIMTANRAAIPHITQRLMPPRLSSPPGPTTARAPQWHAILPTPAAPATALFGCRSRAERSESPHDPVAAVRVQYGRTGEFRVVSGAAANYNKAFGSRARRHERMLLSGERGGLR
ncbi:hypothetical protein CryarDRAFT_3167 [Cryptosporangium arvum DSM 44712]|uniref:Uncharacterized protein n=1 Tax=Cryptosporangium arvum DSM 44712 TaxID=927661 RepID=A0A010YPB8_9ACTN|nr:hypothetical protein CryarDRAFT_3167 [Cryptosporangium arvum DSM 44712]